MEAQSVVAFNIGLRNYYAKSCGSAYKYVCTSLALISSSQNSNQGHSSCSILASKSDETPTIEATTVLLVCTGDACEDVGARDLIKLARQRVPQKVKCKSTGCLGMCGQGPAIAVQDSSGGSLQAYRDVDERKLDAILLELS
jgi:(2Fe-2S) ferredoxin